LFKSNVLYTIEKLSKCKYLNYLAFLICGHELKIMIKSPSPHKGRELFSPLGRKRLPYTPLGEKGTKLPWGAISLGKQVLKCLTRKYRGSNLSKSNIIYTIEKNPAPVYRGPETQVLRVKYRGPETQVLRAKYRGPETQVLRAKYRGPETQVLRARS
jgi:hypothetical protein